MHPDITPDITVKRLLDRYPELLGAFMELRLLCAGCPAEAFHTLGDVARENGLDPDEFLNKLQHAVDNAKAVKRGKFK